MEIMTQLVNHWQAWAISAGTLVGAIVLALIAHKILFSAGKRLAKRTGSVIDNSLVEHGSTPARLILPLLALFVALPATSLPPWPMGIIRHIVALGMIAAVAWLLIILIDVFEDVAKDRYKIGVSDNLRARKIQTEIHVLRRTATVVACIVAFSVMLMTFPGIRQFGVSLFASAGIVGIIVGMAARPMLSNLLAGLQIALTEPIRIEDVVIVEGEWGWIEEIASTYVVVRIWDLRRLVVPISYFIEHPFQNWTRVTADLLGTVFLYTDYTVPVEEIRQELHRILKTTDLWDGKVWGVQVTDATAHVMELRALMSTSDSSKSWDLRCLVREQLITFLQDKYPQSLPRTRVEMDRKDAKPDAPLMGPPNAH
ncbi:MAG TPA: mechanosensitive ion channel family protein [Terriglobia bacterium]|nr:mechanosensitive ion channel family protein [Terriglobia bacterium]